MLFDLSMSELLLIGAVALVVIGPKDLPRALRVAGYWVRRARTLSREFQSSVEQMIREAELDEMRQELKKATEVDFEREFRQSIDPTGDLAESLKPPELPNLSNADMPAVPASALESHLERETESGAAEMDRSAPSSPPPAGEPADAPESGSPPHETIIIPTEADEQGHQEGRLRPGLSPARE
jgi:sec-independent protein translocase protein TatB